MYDECVAYTKVTSIEEHPLEIKINGGTMTVNQTCKIPYLGTHWFH